MLADHEGTHPAREFSCQQPTPNHPPDSVRFAAVARGGLHSPQKKAEDMRTHDQRTAGK
jgi:hypothetical protein